MGIITTIFSFFTSDIFKKLLPYLLVIALAAGIFFYAHHEGYSQAASECNVAEVQAKLDAVIIKNKNLQDQIISNDKTIKDLENKKEKTKIIVQEVTKVIHDTVPKSDVCNIGQETIDALNKVRAGIK